MSTEDYKPRAIKSEHYVDWWVVINNGLGFQPYFESEDEANRYLLTLPSPVQDETCEWYGSTMPYHNWTDTFDGWKRCIHCKRVYKPTLAEDIAKHLPADLVVFPMTEQQALDKSRELWGPNAKIWDRETYSDSKFWKERGISRFWVGCQEFQDHRGNHVYGNGDTWEKAFDAATEYQKGMVR